MFCGPLGKSGCQKVQLVRLRDLDAVDKQKVGQSVVPGTGTRTLQRHFAAAPAGHLHSHSTQTAT